MAFQRLGDLSHGRGTLFLYEPFASTLIRSKDAAQSAERAAEDLLMHLCIWFSSSMTTGNSVEDEFSSRLQTLLTDGLEDKTSGDTSGKATFLSSVLRAFDILLAHVKARQGQFASHVGWLANETALDFWQQAFTTYSSVIRLTWERDERFSDASSKFHHLQLPDSFWKDRRNRLVYAQEAYERELISSGIDQVDQPRLLRFLQTVFGNWQHLNYTEDVTLRRDGLVRSREGRDVIQASPMDLLLVVARLMYVKLLKRMQNHTYHSTQILRDLFRLHASFAEFDEAIQMFDAYTSIIVKEKTSQRKGYEGPELDTDETALQLAILAVRILCRFGSYQHANLALSIGQMIHRWLVDGAPTNARDRPHFDASIDFENINLKSLGKIYGVAATAHALQAIGLCYATYAVTSNDADLRAEFLQQSSTIIRFAMDASEHSQPQYEALESCYMLTSIAVMKGDFMEAITSSRALHSERNSSAADLSLDDNMPRNAVQAIPVQHLRYLISKLRLQPFNPTVTDSADFASTIIEILYPSNDDSADTKSLVEEVDNHGKMNCIEACCTSVTYTGIQSGGNAAVQKCSELIYLYTRLYGPVKEDAGHSGKFATAQSQSTPPKSSKGTVRSIVSRKKNRKSVEQGAGRPLDPVPHNLPSNKPPPPISHEKQPPEQDIRSPVEDDYGEAKQAETRPRGLSRKPGELNIGNTTMSNTVTDARRSHNPNFVAAYPSEITDLRYRTAALTRVWLFISTIYSAAGDHNEAKTAVENAQASVANLEVEVSRQIEERNDTGATQCQGWGPVRTLPQLRADVLSGEGDALMAQIQPPPLRAKFMPSRGMRYPEMPANSEKIGNVASTKYREAIMQCPKHREGTLGLCNRLLDTQNIQNQHEAYALLRELSQSAEGFNSGAVWTLLSTACSEIGRPEEAMSAAKEASRWTSLEGIRNPWGTNAGGFVLW